MNVNTETLSSPCECLPAKICVAFEPCGTGPGSISPINPGGGAGSGTTGVFTTVTIKLFQENGPPTEITAQGAFTIDENGDIELSGIFEGAEPPIWGGSAPGPIDFTIPIPVNTAGATGFEVSVDTIDMTDALMGDLNGDGQISFDDRIAFSAALGTSFGQAGFDPRVDFNGDGVIDAADLAEINTLACIADVNGDGVIDIDDMLLYLVWYNAEDPRADMDGIGGITTDDLDAFVAAFLVGCP